MKKYQKYKDSGVEWIGEIPENWEVKKLKYIAEVNSDTLTEKENDDFELEYIDISSVNSNGEIIGDNHYFFSESPSRARRIVNYGDTIVSTVRTYLKAIAFIDFEKENLICSTGFAVIHPLQGLVPKFLFYIFRYNRIIEKIMALSKGVSYPAIDSEDIKTIEVWMPSPSEQTAIANYLDEKTAKIDKLIANKQKLIELFKEERAAIINQAVTKGIDLNVKLKPSGIEWLGDIPEHWDSLKLKRCSVIITDGEHISPNFINEGVPFLSAKDVRKRYIDSLLSG